MRIMTIIMAIIFFSTEGGFQGCPLFSHYLFHYFVTYSEFGPENDLMVILMDSIMGQLMATLKAPIDKPHDILSKGGPPEAV